MTLKYMYVYLIFSANDKCTTKCKLKSFMIYTRFKKDLRLHCVIHQSYTLSKIINLTFLC